MKTWHAALVFALIFSCLSCSQQVPSIEVPTARARLALTPEMVQQMGTQGTLEIVALVSGPTPTGVAVSRTGRTFLSFPRWGEPAAYTVAELRNGQVYAFPSQDMQKGTPNDYVNKFVSVQSVVVDPADRLWVLDTGSENFGPVAEGAAKLMAFDLNTDAHLKTIIFPSSVVYPTSYLNDVKFDLTKGREGVAYLTDSSDKGPNGIIVVDLASGRSWRKLNDHPSTKAEPGFTPRVEGRPMMDYSSGQSRNIGMGADGIAISSDGRTLFYTPLASRHLYSVSTEALSNEGLPDSAVAETVQDYGDKGFASDGLASDSAGNLYLTDYENNAIHRRSPGGTYSVIAANRSLIWPDTLAMAPDGYLYVSANQLGRQPRFNNGVDRREKPYALFRTKIGTDSMPPMLY